MNKVNYWGIYAEHIEQFIAFKRSLGYKYKEEAKMLARFDRFTIETGETKIGISKDLSEKWFCRHGAESDNYQYSRCVCLNQLAYYLSSIGIRSYMSRLPKRKETFTPYVFSKAEVAAIFTACDEMATKTQKMDSTVFSIPALIRFLYGTGLRINEALSLRNKDVNLIDNYVIVKDSKNGKERAIPLSATLGTVCKGYVEHRDKLPVNISNDSSFFVSLNGTACEWSSIYYWFRKILAKAAIAFTGDAHSHRGPRIHDIRHTTACHALARMAGEGMDLYCSLPVLSAFLGHQSLKATDLYVRLTAEMYPGLLKDVDFICLNVFPNLEYETN